jgi:hypothetical protein
MPLKRRRAQGGVPLKMPSLKKTISHIVGTCLGEVSVFSWISKSSSNMARPGGLGGTPIKPPPKNDTLPLETLPPCGLCFST